MRSRFHGNYFLIILFYLLLGVFCSHTDNLVVESMFRNHIKLLCQCEDPKVSVINRCFYQSSKYSTFSVESETIQRGLLVSYFDVLMNKWKEALSSQLPKSTSRGLEFLNTICMTFYFHSPEKEKKHLSMLCSGTPVVINIAVELVAATLRGKW